MDREHNIVQDLLHFTSAISFQLLQLFWTLGDVRAKSIAAEKVASFERLLIQAGWCQESHKQLYPIST